MARAPGGTAGADAPSVSRDTMRLVAFSDGVFAITITLLALEIKPPTDDSDLLHGLLALWPFYLAYALTFLFIGQVWANHHVMFDHPFYGIAFAALAFNAVWQYACRHRLLSAALDRVGATAISRRFQLALAWLATGAVLGAVLPVLGVAVIFAFNVFYWLPIPGESPGEPEETSA